MRICLAQTDIIWENKKENMKKCEKFISDAGEQSADMIIFPEMTLTGFSMNVEKTGEENEESVEFFKKAAKKNNIYICFGYVRKYKNDFFNTAVIIDRNGIVISRYNKIHPFSYGEESTYFKSGDRTTDFIVNDRLFSCFICYDLRFPEIFQIVSKKCEGIIIIANWNKSRTEHWDNLLKARAIENQCFIIGVNRTGDDYNGHSAVYSPYGIPLNGISEIENLIFCDLDMDECKKYRNEFPLKNDRREKLYYDLEMKHL